VNFEIASITNIDAKLAQRHFGKSPKAVIRRKKSKIPKI